MVHGCVANDTSKSSLKSRYLDMLSLSPVFVVKKQKLAHFGGYAFSKSDFGVRFQDIENKCTHEDATKIIIGEACTVSSEESARSQKSLSPVFGHAEPMTRTVCY